MAKGIDPQNLAAAIGKELDIYAKDVQERVDAVGRKSIKKLVRLTEETAPIGNRRGGNFVTSIASKEIKGVRGSVFVWYVKPPNHRLTHLIVHGHAKKNGGRTKANPFLRRALDTILPEYEEAVKEAIESD